MMKIMAGPLLGLESENDYTICFTTSATVSSAKVMVDGKSTSATLIEETPNGHFWRSSVKVNVDGGHRGRHVIYTISLNDKPAIDAHKRNEWAFYVPAKDEKPLIAYTSCNGVSKSDLLAKIENPFYLWQEMQTSHDEAPFSLLLMGGDQIYADSIWDKVAKLEEWSSLPKQQQISRSISKPLTDQLDRFYSKLYVERWSDPAMSFMLASVPSVMMWDDHDIFDGWGSFPEDLQRCDVFQEIFRHAKRYFELYQMRSKENATLLSSDQSHYSFHFSFRNYQVLGLDNRSDRSIQQVMGTNHWSDMLGMLEMVTTGTLLVMSAVPVVYRDFSLTETAFDITPWNEELEDDLKDHWRAKEHQGERSRLIMNLITNARIRIQDDPTNRTLILSGDVHVGCLGVITDKTEAKTVKIHQVVSSGVVHPAPSLLAWLGIKAVTNDKSEILNEDGTIEAKMLKPVGSHQYIRTRNFTTIQEGTDNKLWINWITESDENPVYPIN